jgi:KipI family sensor histidine kinase inhibitor
MGERALLLETDGSSSALAVLEHCRHHPMDHQVELIPGAASVLVTFSRSLDSWEPLKSIPGPPPAWERDLPDGDEVSIDVVYDGADLDEVGALTGLGAGGIVTAHTAAPWRVAFCGFSPGFGYLTGGDPRLVVARRDTPRPEVPAGSVGLAGEYSGVYPSASPGGWRLIGRTDAVLWDLRRDPPALLQPGMRVRFRAVREAVTGSEATGPAEAAASGAAAAQTVPSRLTAYGPAATETRSTERALVVHRPGMQCTVQDLGRTGVARLGVSPSGAADRGAAGRANRIVGNAVDAAVCEILMGGAEFEARGPLLLAVTGADVPIEVDGADGNPAGHGDAGMDRPIAVSSGARVRLGRPARGLRSYLAVRGGIDVPPVLGSRSTDLLAGIGPAPLRAGDVVAIGEGHWGTPHVVPAEALPDTVDLSALPGPQLDWFVPGTLQRICATRWTVSPASNRVGIRLVGPRPERTVTGELPSQGLVRGAVQVPPSGELVVFLADHPVTGGYPVVAVLTDAAADLAAQARPGSTVRLSPAG